MSIEDSMFMSGIMIRNLPESEQRPGWEISTDLRSLEMDIECFEHALQLFDTCRAKSQAAYEEYDAQQKRATDAKREYDFQLLKNHSKVQRQLAAWCFIAARDGALQIYNLGQRIVVIQRRLGFCPVLRSYVDAQAQRAAKRLFDRTFPDNIHIRDSIAHNAEELVNDYKRHAAEGDGRMIKGIALNTGSLRGYRYELTWRHRLIGIDISQATVEKLKAPVQQFQAAFKQAILASYRVKRGETLKPLVREGQQPQD